MYPALWNSSVCAAALVVLGVVPAMAQPPSVDAKKDRTPSPAAELTRDKLLKVKVLGAFKDERLGDILKELAAQVETSSNQPLMWIYGPGFPFESRLTIMIKDQPVETALDQLLTKVGGGAGYVVVSKAGDRHDGWVRLTSTGERGREVPPLAAGAEAIAGERLALAEKLIDDGKAAAARPLLEVLIRKYATTRTGMEAMTLLGKIEK